MKISRAIIEAYLDHVTSQIGDEGSLPDDVTGYYDSILDMKHFAIKQGDLDILRLAIDKLLTDPKVDAPSFAAIHYDYDKDEMQELLFYIRSVVWPDTPMPNPIEVEGIEFVSMSKDEWRVISPRRVE